MPARGVARYHDNEKRSALQLAAQLGFSAAARELGVDRKTIQRFRDQMPEYWSELQSGPDAAPARRTRSAESLEDLADAYTEREFEALQRAEKLIKTADGKELAALMRAMGASRGLATAGARQYRGEDVHTVEHNINFAALEMAAQAILERAPTPPILVENLAEKDDAV
jgi:transposase-like protein